MILNYKRYIAPHDNVSEIGNLIELENNQYVSLLKDGSVEFKRSDLLEEDSLVSNYALVYKEEDTFPYDFMDQNIIKEFLSTMFLCQYELNKLVLINESNLLDLLPLIRNKKKNIPTLSKSLKSLSTIDKRLPEYLSNKHNFMGQVCCGCGFSDETLTCHDIQCYSDYVWIVNGICHAYFGGDISASFVNLFPFTIRKEPDKLD